MGDGPGRFSVVHHDHREPLAQAVGKAVVEEDPGGGGSLAGGEGRPQDRGVEAALAVGPEQDFFDLRFIPAVVAHGPVGLVVRRGKLGQGAAIDADGGANHQVLDPSHEGPQERFGVLGGEGHHVDDRVEGMLAHGVLEVLGLPTVAMEDLDALGNARLADAPVEDRHVVAPLDQLVHDGGGDQPRPADKKNFHENLLNLLRICAN